MVEFRERLGLTALIDIHTHFMPKPVMDKVWAYFDAAGPLTGREWPIRYRMEEQSRLEHLRAFGVSRFTSMLYPHKPEMAAWLNQWAADFAARTPDCLHTATFYPEVSAPGYVTAALEAGARVFKSHVQVGDYDPNDPLLEPVWGLLADSGTPIVIHCGSGPAPGRFTGPDRIARLLARHPRLALVIAHMGMPEYAEFLDLADRYPNVCLDTTMAFTDFSESQIPFPRSEVPRLRDLQDRILFGSDFPNIPYSYLDALEALERFDLGDDWVRAVAHHNAAVLFGIS
ncbi:amidohydrolase family protein [Rhodococcus sp. ABRD24]|uniref:amidohydrolase family protein n=1 Tax=Rhodococcus sp. ABRD24 TaxID=2507582 RepID=UPI001F60FE10|nr:amidohydrolase family protein [Rhodococcus sp. ABRD24]